MSNSHRNNERSLDDGMSVLLRVGVTVSGALIALGWLLAVPLLVSGGLFALMALPILRVGFSAVYFLWNKDFLYVALSGTVLLILCGGILFGIYTH